MADAVALLDGRPTTAEALDALVATQIMGDIFGPLSPEEEREALRILAVEDLMRPHLPPAYSTDIAAAWRVITEMGVRGWWLRLTSPFNPGRAWHAGFTPHDTTGWNGRPDHEAAASEPALALCLAALLAVGACKAAEAIAPDCVRPGGAA